MLMASRGSAAIAWVGCALAVIGALGPWAKAFSLSASGLDGSNDGWIVIVLALVAACIVLAGVLSQSALARFFVSLVGFGAGIGILATGLYDRSNLTDNIAANNAQGIASVEWGLNLTIVSGFIVMFAALGVWAFRPLSEARPSPAAEPLPNRPAPGWYADPRRQQRLRYWDGTTWTDSTAP